MCGPAGMVRALVATGLGTGLATKKVLGSDDTERCAPPDVLRRLVENMPDGAAVKSGGRGGQNAGREI